MLLMMASCTLLLLLLELLVQDGDKWMLDLERIDTRSNDLCSPLAPKGSLFVLLYK